MLAVENNPKTSQKFGMNLRDDDDLFDLAVKKERLIEYKSQNFRKKLSKTRVKRMYDNFFIT